MSEPVAWKVVEGTGVSYLSSEPLHPSVVAACRPLYTTPPQRKPLTDDEIKNIVDLGLQTWKLSESTYAFARAIEAAHGIGGEHE